MDEKYTQEALHVTRGPGKSLAGLLWQRAKCMVGQHRAQVHQEFGAFSRRIICPYCRGDWAHLSHPDGEMWTEWGNDFTLLYKSIGFNVIPTPAQTQNAKRLEHLVQKYFPNTLKGD
jgi:hypothetical protein